MADEKTPSRWGRVDDDGTVYVLAGDSERAVGQYPDATPEEAIAYFARKFTELEGQVGLLEQRVRSGAPAQDVAKAISTLSATVQTANAVGDLESLAARLEKLAAGVGELTEKQSEEAKAAIADALAAREALVVEAEALAAKDPATVQWKQAGADLDALFARWQTQQSEGPRLPRKEADELWRRFRTARGIVDGHRKAFYAELDSTHREARSRKQALAEQAEALAPKGAAAIPDYRRLLDEWKTAGRAGKKVDDALWSRFKAAGDALYGAKAEADARESEEFGANLTAKLALLDDAEKLLKATDRASARETLAGIQKKWDAIGKVPRDSLKSVEDRLRKVEAHVRKLDEDHWHRTDPEKQARSEGFAAQLQAKIAQLEEQLASAKKSGDAKKAKDAEDALASTKIWLDALN